MPLNLLINTSDPQQRGLINSILDGGIAPFPNFTRNDQSVAIAIQPVVPSATDTRSFDVDYTAGDTYQVSIGSADEAPTAGTFALEIDGVTTDLTSLDFDVSAEDLEDPLSAASVAGGNPAVTVTLLSEGVYQVDGVTNGVLPTIAATATNLIPVCSAVVTVIAQGTASTKGQQIIALVQQPAAYATPSTALPTASVTVSTEQAASSSLNKIIRIAFAAGTYGGLYSLSATVNSVTAVCGSVSPVASIGELSAVLGRHPQLRYNNANAADNFTVSTDGAAYLVEFIGNLGGPIDPTLAATNVSLLAPFGASGTISLNTVNMAKMFWASGVESLALTLSIVRTRTSGEVKTILSIPVTVPADIINAGSLTPLSVSGAVRYDISQSLSASEKLQAVTNQGLNLTASKLLGQASSGGTGLPVAITLGTNLSMSGTTLNAVDSATGTVTSVSVTTANGVSGTVATATTTPAISLTLGAITPTSVNGVTFSGSGSLANSGTSSLTGFTGSGTSSGTNTGDQTSVSGNAGTATALQTTRTIGGSNFDGTGNVTSFPSPGAIGGTTPAAGAFTTINGNTITAGTGTLTLSTFTLTATATGNVAITGGNLSQFAATSSAQLAGVVNDETGTGLLVFNTSPSLISPSVRPSIISFGTILASAAASTDKTATFPNATGTVLLDSAIGVSVQAYDADLTTWAGITPGANVGTFLATPSSANLAAAVTDETGTGALVFGTSPTFTTSVLIPDGTEALPGIRFSSDTDTGFWREGTNQMRAVVGGSGVCIFSTDGTTQSWGFATSLTKRTIATGEVHVAMQAFSGAIWGVRIGDPAAKTYIRAAAAQTANIMEWQNSAGTALTYISSAGALTVGSTLAVTSATTLTGLLTANGGITLGDAQNIAFNTTTGTKIGAATTQKLSFWNATPIVQPTTAVSSATVVSPGGGTNLKTDDTFDGYTIAQVVKALRNAGLLA